MRLFEYFINIIGILLTTFPHIVLSFPSDVGKRQACSTYHTYSFNATVIVTSRIGISTKAEPCRVSVESNTWNAGSNFTATAITYDGQCIYGTSTWLYHPKKKWSSAGPTDLDL